MTRSNSTTHWGRHLDHILGEASRLNGEEASRSLIVRGQTSRPQPWGGISTTLWGRHLYHWCERSSVWCVGIFGLGGKLKKQTNKNWKNDALLNWIYPNITEMCGHVWAYGENRLKTKRELTSWYESVEGPSYVGELKWKRARPVVLSVDQLCLASCRHSREWWFSRRPVQWDN
jgi:hypothetical protein